MRSARPPRIRLLATCLVLVVIAGGCVRRESLTDASPPDPLPDDPIPPSLDPIVFPRGPGGGGGPLLRDRRPVDDEDAGWSEKLELARGYADGGYDDEALAFIRGALAQDPPAVWDERFRVLRSTLRARRVESDWLRADARGTRDYVTFGSDIDWVVRIRNVSENPLILQGPRGREAATSPAAVSLAITRRDVDIYGAELERSWNRTVFLQRSRGRDVRIEPGAAHEATVRIAAADVGGAISGIRILEMTGTLRAHVSDEAGEEMQSVGLRIRSGRVVVLSEGYEPLARDPLASMNDAIDAVAPTHLLVATEFVSRGGSDRAIERLTRALVEGDPGLRTAALGGLGLMRERNVGRPLARFATPLIDALSRAPDRAPAVMEGLTRLTGQALAPDPRLWMDWWRRAERHGTTVPPPERSRGIGLGEDR